MGCCAEQWIPVTALLPVPSGAAGFPTGWECYHLGFAKSIRILLMLLKRRCLVRFHLEGSEESEELGKADGQAHVGIAQNYNCGRCFLAQS